MDRAARSTTVASSSIISRSSSVISSAETTWSITDDDKGEVGNGLMNSSTTDDDDESTIASPYLTGLAESSSTRLIFPTFSTLVIASANFIRFSSSSSMVNMGNSSSSPSTGSTPYLRRISFRVIPESKSSFKSKTAFLYSLACHSAVVSSGFPNSSHLTYALISARDSGT